MTRLCHGRPVFMYEKFLTDIKMWLSGDVEVGATFGTEVFLFDM